MSRPFVCAWVKEFVRLILIIPVFSYLLRRYSFLFYRGKVHNFTEKYVSKIYK